VSVDRAYFIREGEAKIEALHYPTFSFERPPDSAIVEQETPRRRAGNPEKQ
jgi:hypothetical protein